MKKKTPGGKIFENSGSRSWRKRAARRLHQAPSKSKSSRPRNRSPLAQVDDHFPRTNGPRFISREITARAERVPGCLGGHLPGFGSLCCGSGSGNTRGTFAKRPYGRMAYEYSTGNREPVAGIRRRSRAKCGLTRTTRKHGRHERCTPPSADGVPDAS